MQTNFMDSRLGHGVIPKAFFKRKKKIFSKTKLPNKFLKTEYDGKILQMLLSIKLKKVLHLLISIKLQIECLSGTFFRG